MSTEETPMPTGNAPDGNISGVRPAIPDHELIRRIGRGSYGEVWLARNVMGTYRAVKIVYRSTFEEDRPYEREFDGIQKFEPISRSHDGQMNILHVGRNDEGAYFYYLMELADDAHIGQASSHCGQGETPPVLLDSSSYFPKTIKNEIRRRGRLPANECIEIALALTAALGHLHKNGLVHRDIKPSNIIYVNGRPKLADIGLVTSVDATRSYVGTEGFAPPEGPGTPQADIYALGKVLYEISTGRDRQEFPDLPTRLGASTEEESALLELNEVILKACQVESSRRYQRAEAMNADLQLLQRGKSLARRRAFQRRMAVTSKIGLLVVGLTLLTETAFLIKHWLRNKDDEERLGKPAYQVNVSALQLADEIPNSQFQFESLADAIRSKAGQYSRLTPGIGVGTSTFTPVRLNGQPVRWGNEYFDAVRFKTPSENELDMVFAFTLYNRHLAWALFPLEGTMEGGFRRFWQRPATRYENVPAPVPDGQHLARRTSAELQTVAAQGATNEALRRVLEASAPGIQVVSVTGLSGKFLEPNREYLLWFKFQRNKPAEFQFAMNFVPAGVSSETNLVSLEKALGLVVKENAVDKAKSKE